MREELRAIGSDAYGHVSARVNPFPGLLATQDELPIWRWCWR